MQQFHNCTPSTEFLILGFNKLQDLRVPLFLIFLIIYITICLENILIIVLVSTSNSLNTPMYFILKSMSLCDIAFVTNFVPKLLHDLLSEQATISITGCIIQLQLYSTTGNTVSFHYALMSYDRYSAIANPLRYSSVIDTKFCLRWIIVFWVMSFTFAIIISFFLRQLVFCSGNVIDHVHCDINPMIELASSDTRLLLLIIAVSSSLIILIPLIFALFTYVFIMYTILKIPTAIGRKKAFSTCSSHLFVISITYGLILSMYILPSRVTTPQVSKGFSLMYILIIPLVNPIIYTLRNKDIHKAFNIKVKALRRYFDRYNICIINLWIKGLK